MTVKEQYDQMLDDQIQRAKDLEDVILWAIRECDGNARYEVLGPATRDIFSAFSHNLRDRLRRVTKG